MGHFEQNDPFQIFRIQNSYLFPNTSPRVEGQANTGDLTHIYSPLYFQRIPATGAGSQVVDRCVLTGERARELEAMLRRVSSRQQIPWIAGPASLLPGIGTVITLASSTVDGLNRMYPAHQLSADELATLMAEGAGFIKTWAREIDGRHGVLLATMVFYSVSVQRENRLYAVYSNKASFRSG